jgi:hypothetical protein
LIVAAKKKLILQLHRLKEQGNEIFQGNEGPAVSKSCFSGSFGNNIWIDTVCFVLFSSKRRVQVEILHIHSKFSDVKR